MCRSLDAWPNDTASTTTSSSPSQAPSCPVWHQWCPYVGSCLPLSRPCQPGSCPNCSGVEPLPPGTLRPHYSLVGEVMFTLPPGASTQILVRQLSSKSPNRIFIVLKKDLTKYLRHLIPLLSFNCGFSSGPGGN